ncbi:MAG: TetR/AcrR family transcriptional regulator [Mogibacterium sp.]|nr:TetR/AcrR family transcriptional regulator [Mogibacterium sp.]
MVDYPSRPTDKRSLRSRNAIENALIRLLKTQPLESITVTSLISEAGYSRTAFYNNYMDIRDCLDCLINRHAEQFYNVLIEYGNRSISNIGEPITYPGNVHELFFRAPYELVYSNKDFYSVLILLPEQYIFAFINNVLGRLNVEESFELKGFETENVNAELWLWSYVWDTIGRVIFWIKNGMIYSPEYMGRQQYLKRLDKIYMKTKDSKDKSK